MTIAKSRYVSPINDILVPFNVQKREYIRCKSDIIKHVSMIPKMELLDILIDEEKTGKYWRTFIYPNSLALPLVATGLFYALLRALTECDLGEKNSLLIDLSPTKKAYFDKFIANDMRTIRNLQILVSIANIESEEDELKIFSRIAAELEGKFETTNRKGNFKKNVLILCGFVSQIILRQRKYSSPDHPIQVEFSIVDYSFITQVGPILVYDSSQFPCRGHEVELDYDYIEVTRDNILDQNYWNSDNTRFKSISSNLWHRGYVCGGFGKWKTRWEDIRVICCFFVNLFNSFFDGPKLHICHDDLFHNKLFVLGNISGTGASPVRLVSDDYPERIAIHVKMLEDSANTPDLSILKYLPDQDTPVYISRYYSTMIGYVHKTRGARGIGEIHPITGSRPSICIRVRDGIYYHRDKILIDHGCVVRTDKMRRSISRSHRAVPFSSELRLPDCVYRAMANI